MSGPDDRRGTDGGEHPLDVDARFADIVSHFHDGEPAAPRFVEGSSRDAGPDVAEPAAPGRHGAEPDGADGPVGADGPDAPDGPDGPDDAADRGTPAGRPEDPVAPAGPPARARAWRPEAEDPLLAELEAAERAGREERARRIEAEVDRSVDGPDSRFVPADPPPLPRPSDLPGRLAWTAVLLGPLLLLLCALLWRSAPPWLVGAIATAMVAGFGYLVWRLPRTRDRDDPGDGAIV